MTPTCDSQSRRAWISVLAKAPPARLAGLMSDLAPHVCLRAPEIGTVMVQGRIGARGAAFNLGEMTVTRCSVQLPCGTVGHACVQGRDLEHARRAAVADALLQTAEGPALEAAVLAPLRSEADSRRATRSARAQATRVEFFTMVRGDDQ